MPAATPDPKSFDEFYHEHKGQLLGAMLAATGNRRDAEDIVQDSFVRVLERWDRVAMMERPDGYLFRVAYRLRTRHLKSTLRRGGDDDRGTRRPLDPGPSVDAHLDLLEGLSHLRLADRKLLVLSAWLGLNDEELAELLQLKPGTVRVRLHRARRALSAQIGGTDEYA